MTKNLTKKNKSGGFTLLFALLVSVLVLAVGASVISVSLRQSVLSNTGRESQYAFYAANTGIECALYWDVNPPSQDVNVRVFPFNNGIITQTRDTVNLNNVKCAGGNIEDGSGFPSGSGGYTGNWEDNGNTTIFRIALSDQSVTADIPEHNVYCAEVKVEKSLSPEGDILTTITSQGLNTCNIDNPRAVQRGLVLQYLQ